MSNKLLYFPYINVPNSTWFTRMLLYWDEIGTIIPYEYIENPANLNDYTRSLVKESLVKQIMPGQYLYKIGSFKESFIKYLNGLSKSELLQRQKKFKSGEYFRIHLEKMDGLESEFMRMKLAEHAEYPWYYVERNTAREFMAYLAATLGKLDEINLSPISDDLDHLDHFLHASKSAKKTDNEISSLRLEVLDDLFPAPTKPLSASQIGEFKSKHGDKLSKFRLRVEQEILTIADMRDKTLKDKRLALFIEEAKESTQELINEMNKSGFGRLSLTKFGSIVSSIPGISQIFGLANSVIDAFKNEKIPTLDATFLYAAFAQKEILK